MSIWSILRTAGLSLLGLVFASVWLVAAVANFANGVNWAGPSPYWLVWGVVSIGLDAAKAVGFLGMAAAWRHRHYAAMVCWLIIWMPSLGFSVNSCWSFAAYTLSDATATRTMRASSDGRLIKQIDDQVAQVVKLQDLKMRSAPSSWTRIEEEIGRVEERIARLRGEARTTTTVGAANPASALLARWIDPEILNLWPLLMFLLGVEAITNVGMLAFRALIARDVVAEVSQVMDGKKTRVRQAKKEPPKAIKPLGQADQATALIRALEEAHGEGVRVPVGKTFDAYKAMATERRWGEPMTHAKLGFQLKKFGVTKDRDEDRRIDYYVLPTQREKAAILPQ